MVRVKGSGDINDLEVGSTFYTIKDYEIKFKGYGAQYLGIITRGENPYMLYRALKTSEATYELMSIAEKDWGEVECGAHTVLESELSTGYTYSNNKEEVISKWMNNFQEIMQGLRDYVNNVQTEDEPEIHGIDIHENWIKNGFKSKEVE